jgi:serine/threonine-protein kinase RsbW
LAGGPAAAPANAAPLQVERTVQARLESLPLVFKLVDGFAARAGLAPALAHDLRLVVEEACVNVVHHAYAGQPPGELTVAIALDTAARPAELRISLRDRGVPFDPLALPAPDPTLPLEQRPVGGLGVWLMRRLTDRQAYRHDPAQGNVLSLVKHLPDPGANPHGATATPSPAPSPAPTPKQPGGYL